MRPGRKRERDLRGSMDCFVRPDDTHDTSVNWPMAKSGYSTTYVDPLGILFCGAPKAIGRVILLLV
jgi:hypothetical protein